MIFWILPISCTPNPRFIVIQIRESKVNDLIVKKPLEYYYNTIKVCIGDHFKLLVHNSIQVDNTNKYIDNFRKIGESHTEQYLWNGDG